jgi:TatA/E family protein of Tat protein translocase
VFNLSPFKIMIIVAVILVVLGPDKLPQAARQIGNGWRSLKQFQQKVESEVRDAIPTLPSSGDLARVVRSPVNLLNELADRAASPESLGDVDDAPLASEIDEVEEREAYEPREHRPPSAPPDPSWN